MSGLGLQFPFSFFFSSPNIDYARHADIQNQPLQLFNSNVKCRRYMYIIINAEYTYTAEVFQKHCIT
jgi:hypothetical protein